jgi:hypothetical protein
MRSASAGLTPSLADDTDGRSNQPSVQGGTSLPRVTTADAGSPSVAHWAAGVPHSNPDVFSSRDVGYGGQESILPDDLSAGLIPEGELAPAWRAMKRGIHQAFRRKRAETFDEVTLTAARYMAGYCFGAAAFFGVLGLALVSATVSPGPRLAGTIYLWGAAGCAVLFLLNLPRLGLQEWLEQEHLRASAAGVSAVCAAIGEGA